VPFNGDTPVEIAMKHLSAVPEPPSVKRPEVPEGLDQIVLRALAKDPHDRYQSAEEMDADLERVARGLAVSPQTEEAATTVLRGADLAAAMPTTIQRAPTAVTARQPPVPPASVYYDYDEPPQRRAFWPWLLAILLVVGAAVAAVYVYSQIQDELDSAKPVGVPLVVGLREGQAVDNIRKVGLRVDPAHIHRQPDSRQPVGIVFKQDPDAGERIDKNNFVSIYVSTGVAKTNVPDVRGMSRDDAVAKLTAANLKPDVHEVHSTSKPEGTVVAQDPKPNARVNEGTKVRINVAAGPQPVAMPNVVGQAYDSAASYLQGQGFAVARKDVESSQPAGVVVDTDPASGTLVSPGSSITLKVSKGPKQQQIPSVENLDVDSAKSVLTESGFKASVTYQDTNDSSLDGVVITQSPGSGTQAPPGTTVTLTVGRYVAPATTAPTGTTTALPPPPAP